MNSALIFFIFFFKAAQSHKYRPNFLGPAKKSSFVEKSNVEKLTKVLREDLNSKVDEVVDLIATDLERELLKNGLTNLSLMQQSDAKAFGGKAKEIIKKTLIGVMRSLIPVFERWIHDSVQPPVVDRHVYTVLIHPIGYRICEQIHEKLKINEPNPWKNDEFAEEEMEEEEEGDSISDEAIDQLLDIVSLCFSP
uniref:Cell-traversal protein for ookinetes and sporozoites domain-containing protein n=1 Tax=Theileria annulata TaxID=5874 RepID=A0A3B0MET8_THEAN